MLGNRGSSDGIECDAFSRRSWRMLSWRRGDLRKIKRAFSKRTRKRARLAVEESTSEARR
jgi:hypothetical protein